MVSGGNGTPPNDARPHAAALGRFPTSSDEATGSVVHVAAIAPSTRPRASERCYPRRQRRLSAIHAGVRGYLPAILSTASTSCSTDDDAILALARGHPRKRRGGERRTTPPLEEGCDRPRRPDPPAVPAVGGALPATPSAKAIRRGAASCPYGAIDVRRRSTRRRHPVVEAADSSNKTTLSSWSRPAQAPRAPACHHRPDTDTDAASPNGSDGAENRRPDLAGHATRRTEERFAWKRAIRVAADLSLLASRRPDRDGPLRPARHLVDHATTICA
jgi:hypothetical protein